MISEFEQIRSLFTEISRSIEEEVNVYLIGGGALMYHKSKNLTKDVDIIVGSEKEFDSVRRSLEEAGFISVSPDHGTYSRMAMTQIFIRDEFRIDLFCRTVCNKFSLSEDMMKRAEIVGRFGTITLHVCSAEDIFLFKCMTERKGDLDDCVRIIYEHLVDWGIILGEAMEQSRIGQEVWITWITVRLEELEDIGFRIPIMKEMRTLSDQFYENYQI
jgi:hypothetical protein